MEDGKKDTTAHGFQLFLWLSFETAASLLALVTLQPGQLEVSSPTRTRGPERDGGVSQPVLSLQNVRGTLLANDKSFCSLKNLNRSIFGGRGAVELLVPSVRDALCFPLAALHPCLVMPLVEIKHPVPFTQFLVCLGFKPSLKWLDFFQNYWFLSSFSEWSV